MIFEHSNYRSFLKSTLVERINRNPSYSLRAMARDLGVNASQLSGIHAGTRGLSHASALQVAERLGLTENEKEYFCLLVEYENAKSPELKQRYLDKLHSLNREAPIQDLSLDLFKMMSDWYHIPILEMTALENFDFSPASIAEHLGITRLEAEVAIERLLRLEMLEKDPEGRYRKTHVNYSFNSEVPNKVIQTYHRKMLEKAIESLPEQTPQQRYIVSQTISIDPSLLDQAKKKMDQFRKELVTLFDQPSRRTKAYQLELVFFDLTNHEKEGERK